MIKNTLALWEFAEALTALIIDPYEAADNAEGPDPMHEATLETFWLLYECDFEPITKLIQELV